MADIHFERRISVSAFTRPVRTATVYEHIVWPYRTILPLMNMIALYVQIKKYLLNMVGVKPETNFNLVDGISINSRRVKEGSARWPALDACYNFVAGEGKTQIERVVDNFWMHIRNAQAVRNRLKIAKQELRKAIRVLHRPGETVRILSLAAGTAQGVIEVMRESLDQGISVRAVLVDLDPTALRHARDLAYRAGVGESLETREGDVLFFNRVLYGFEPDIIEMMGLTDYLKDKIAVALFKKIRRHLKSGGYFLTCHVHPNGETFFLRHVVNWDMIYRKLDEFEGILVDSGFLRTRFEAEPHGIHSVAIAQKLT